jgi:hypothetical protein
MMYRIKQRRKLMSAPQSSSAQIIKAFQDNHYVIKRQSHQITNTESLIEPPFRGNTMNWVVGHILVGRDEVLTLLEAKPVMPHPADVESYQTGSDPKQIGYNPVPFNRLLDLLNESQIRLEKALTGIPDPAFSKIVQTAVGPKSLQAAINDLHWHETYHAGQLELLRQLAGKDDAIF